MLPTIVAKRPEPVADSVVSVRSGQYETESYGGGGELAWTPAIGLHVRASYLQGAQRLSLIQNSLLQQWRIGTISGTGVGNTTAVNAGASANGQHLTNDRSSRFAADAAWTFAKDDITVRARMERETHAYPAWTQSPIPQPGLSPVDHPHFENVSFERNVYLDAARDIENSRTTLSFGWDRNWRHYLDREVKTTLEVDLTQFGMGVRMQRFSMFVDNGIVKQLNVEAPGKFEVSDAATMLKQLG